MNIAIPEAKRKKVADALVKLLADTYALYFKTHSYHWNVEAPAFFSLHSMFEGQYTALHDSTDELAERIRALGRKAPASYAALAAEASVTEDANVPDWKTMVSNLIRGHEVVIKTARTVHAVAVKAGDEVTADLMVERLSYSEKTAWMLRATLGG
jgi:starvation-inducible DNA-binding protein